MTTAPVIVSAVVVAPPSTLKFVVDAFVELTLKRNAVPEAKTLFQLFAAAPRFNVPLVVGRIFWVVDTLLDPIRRISDPAIATRS